MTQKTIMLACDAGMSTSLLVNKMKKVAKEKNLDYKIFATPVSHADSYLEKEEINLVLLGPQVRYMLKDMKAIFDPKGIPVEVIPMTDYGMMNAKNVLALAESLL
ncbi:PTS sugar transporter subunit IIB [Anaerococcus marasmi]|uniref:PTS sugar transporter subunit IIB n=1 Tax=Anaerococcus marasmi TaxID=2057797 RepID=UPI000CF90EFB|nr:PTS sugar transporter subunit IIB [Anaerococcus marasmi]